MGSGRRLAGPLLQTIFVFFWVPTRVGSLKQQKEYLVELRPDASNAALRYAVALITQSGGKIMNEFRFINSWHLKLPFIANSATGNGVDSEDELDDIVTELKHSSLIADIHDVSADEMKIEFLRYKRTVHPLERLAVESAIALLGGHVLFHALEPVGFAITYMKPFLAQVLKNHDIICGSFLTTC